MSALTPKNEHWHFIRFVDKKNLVFRVKNSTRGTQEVMRSTFWHKVRVIKNANTDVSVNRRSLFRTTSLNLMLP